MEIIPFRLTENFQPDLSLSVFLERFSGGTSETSRTIRLAQVLAQAILSQEAYGILLLPCTVIELIVVCRQVVSERSLRK